MMADNSKEGNDNIAINAGNPGKEKAMLCLLQVLGLFLLLGAGALLPRTIACLCLAFITSGWLTALFIILLTPAFAMDYSENAVGQFLDYAKARNKD